jgi:exopolyphosphatase/guanosine-5'-triphosphate,3'-diphosphate pyrophosphatase
MLIRIVDIGSNSVKSSVYAVEKQDHKLLAKDKLSFSLGEEVFATGTITESAQDKVARFISDLPDTVGGAKVHFTFILATSAVRSARNKDAFARRVEAKTGTALRILSGDEESFLIHMGIASTADAGNNEIIKTIDIGGGSAEISWSRGFEYLAGHSFDLGAIRLAQRFLKGKTFSREAYELIYEHCKQEFKTRYALIAPPPSQRAFGSSGNLRAIQRMTQNVRGGPFLKLMPEITIGSLEDVAELAMGKSAQGIQSLFDISLDRARIIMPAVVVLAASMRWFGIPRLSVSEAGLREGAAYWWSRHGHLNLPFEAAAHETAEKR